MEKRQLAKRELSFRADNIASSLARGFGLTVLAGVIVGFLGPFGTYDRLDLPHRMGFWLSALCGGYWFHMPLYWLGRAFSESRGLPIAFAIFGSAAVAALPTAILVNGIAASFLNITIFDRIESLYPYVLVISVPMQMLAHLMALRAGERSSTVFEPIDSDASGQPVAPSITGVPTAEAERPKPEPSTSGVDRFLKRLPVRLGTDIQCLQMEDHYLRVFTPLGSELILMRMADAADELSALDGLLVHRSFWVARSAVTAWSRDGKSLILHLGDGKAVPVARDRQAAVKQAGWLPPNRKKS